MRYIKRIKSNAYLSSTFFCANWPGTQQSCETTDELIQVKIKQAVAVDDRRLDERNSCATGNWNCPTGGSFLVGGGGTPASRTDDAKQLLLSRMRS